MNLGKKLLFSQKTCRSVCGQWLVPPIANQSAFAFAMTNCGQKFAGSPQNVLLLHSSNRFTLLLQAAQIGPTSPPKSVVTAQIRDGAGKVRRGVVGSMLGPGALGEGG